MCRESLSKVQKVLRSPVCTALTPECSFAGLPVHGAVGTVPDRQGLVNPGAGCDNINTRDLLIRKNEDTVLRETGRVIPGDGNTALRENIPVKTGGTTIRFTKCAAPVLSREKIETASPWAEPAATSRAAIGMKSKQAI